MRRGSLRRKRRNWGGRKLGNDCEWKQKQTLPVLKGDVIYVFTRISIFHSSLQLPSGTRSLLMCMWGWKTIDIIKYHLFHFRAENSIDKIFIHSISAWRMQPGVSSCWMLEDHKLRAKNHWNYWFPCVIKIALSSYCTRLFPSFFHFSRAFQGPWLSGCLYEKLLS